MRILIWHGYLLGGTGSNVYTRALARAWSRQGHDVVVFCQEPHPERFDLAGAQVVRPLLDGRLPVFVRDHYEDVEPCLLPDMPTRERQRFVEVNATAITEALPADLLLVNHVLLGAPVGAATGMPFVVKAHGSELEFAMRGHPELCAWAAESLSGARLVLAGSEHVVGVLHELLGDGAPPDRTRVLPPGVDVEGFRPQGRQTALRALIDECRRDAPNPRDAHDERRPDEDNADRLAEFLTEPGPTVVYVGKLSEEKGVGMLLDAAASSSGLGVRLVVVGFGPQREELEQRARGKVLFTGPLEHRHLAHLWPLADVSVTPSVFPEAFGMVAAEAAACGSPPLVARHSGLAEIAAALASEYPDDLRPLTAFAGGDVADLTATLRALLTLPRRRWGELSRAARRTATSRWSWDAISAELLALGTI